MESFESYVKKRNLKLGKDIVDRKKIYLDTKYWVDFCNIALQKNTNNAISKVYEYSRKLVEENKVIFPISYRIYIELLRQSDEETLFETVKIMDYLSQGVAIISEEERVELEILYFLRKNTSKSKEINLHEPIELVWTKIVNILGVMSPQLSAISLEENLQVKKMFFDYTWDMSLYKMLLSMGMDNIGKFPTERSITDELNLEKIEYFEQNNTLNQTYMSELSAILDLYREKFNNLLQHIHFEYFKVESIDSEDQQDYSNQVANIIYYMFEKQKNEIFLPSWDIMAKIHALIRWDKNRKYKDNDFNDIGHIVTALPYFDYFFTEKSFSSLITQSKYNDKYNCKVVWKYEDALSELKEIKGA
ncbi:hypothetical protein [Sulfurovum riftiae]|uniref:Uncharacterized protein n=1 Tax=Sulfurovum riftiae TaxID=1630136 RepID=A0A151CE24_9BACT|nr:hypothetical protein [Sulfurovum riftiae]KYJ85778.1 hypothetical protein AS592_03295 [Sulfurovum riftiae]